MGLDASTRPSRVDLMLRKPGHLGYLGWDELDRDGMEGVSDWVVCVLLVLWASRS